MSTTATTSTPMRSLTMRRYNYMLLEVLIALALLSLCFMPLLAPQFALLTAQKKLVGDLENDRIAAQMFLDIKERMYNNTIALDDIPVKERNDLMKEGEGLREGFEIVEALPDGTAKTFAGHYEIFRRQKGSTALPMPYHLIIVKLYFYSNKAMKPYVYNIMAERINGEADDENTAL